MGTGRSRALFSFRNSLHYVFRVRRQRIVIHTRALDCECALEVYHKRKRHATRPCGAADTNASIAAETDEWDENANRQRNDFDTMEDARERCKSKLWEQDLFVI